MTRGIAIVYFLMLLEPCSFTTAETHVLTLGDKDGFGPFGRSKHANSSAFRSPCIHRRDGPRRAHQNFSVQR